MANSKADLHVHSKYSNRPSEWFLRRIGAPECFVEPMDVYTSAKRKGMDFVTITDHNCIGGAKEIAHLPDTFISCEFTTYFPHNNCKVHCLAIDITEAQFETLQSIRENIYDFREHLHEENILYSISHPLFSVNDRLTLNDVEKLLVLFNRFEGLNGTRHPRASMLLKALFGSLTPKLIEDLANKHQIRPFGSTPWQKRITGGSDDHSGIYIASAYTVTPEANTLQEFIQHLRNNRHDPDGITGTSLKMAHSFYTIAYGYYKHRFVNSSDGNPTLIGKLLAKLIDNDQQKTQVPVYSSVKKVMNKAAWQWKKRKLSDIEQMLITDFTELFQTEENKQLLFESNVGFDERSFALACTISQQLSYTFFKKFTKYLQKGAMLESLQTFSSLGPVALSIAPYLAAFKTQHKDQLLLEDVTRRFSLPNHFVRSEKKIWITDTYGPDPASRFTRTLVKEANRTGHELTLLTCLNKPPQDLPVKNRNFEPVGSFILPECHGMQLAFPPFMEIIEYLEREQVSEIIVSSPGPMGLVGIAAARLLKINISGVYLSNLPTTVVAATDDESVEGLVWRYLQWFYAQVDRVYAMTAEQREFLNHKNLAVDKLVVLPLGVDHHLFSPDKRRTEIWSEIGDYGEVKFLSITPMLQDDGTKPLIEAFCELCRQGYKAKLMLVGNGPQLKFFKKKYEKRQDIVFVEEAKGQRLAELYASADVYIYAGNAFEYVPTIIEAQSSGLPVLVNQDCKIGEEITTNGSGVVANSGSAFDLLPAMESMCNAEKRSRMSQRARKAAERSTWQNVISKLWEGALEPERALADSTPESDASAQPANITPPASPAQEKILTAAQ